MTTARLGVAILAAALPAAAAAQPASPAARLLAPREVARPAPVGAAPAHVTPHQVTALTEKLVRAQPPLAARQVYAVAGDEVVRVTDDNIGQVLSRSPLTAERLGSVATQAAVPAALAAKLGPGATGGAAGPAVQAFALPTRFTALPLGGAEPVHFNVLFAVLDALRYDGAAGRFVARLALALVNPALPEDASALSHEVPILIAADGAVLAPAEVVRFNALNAPVVLHLTVEAPIDPYAVRALTALQREPDSIFLPVNRPKIEIIAGSNGIRGLGLEETPITVRVAGAKGRQGEVVVLKSDRGALEPSQVRLDPASGTGVAALRSAHIGWASLEATDPPFSPGEAHVRFQWPVRFAFAIVLGGAVGAVLRKDARRRMGRSLLLGLLSALVVGVAYAAGISLGFLGIPAGLTGDGVFFAVAALAGFLGREAVQGLAGAWGK